jgi:cytoskeleton protein RodZ
LTELTGVGAELKQARESRGLSIEDVAQQLKFAPRQIESLEAERFERLPGPTIARGMVRNYARLLKLEPDSMLERMAPRVAPAPDSAELAARFKQPVPFSDSGRRSTLIYAGFSIGVLLLVAVVAYTWQHEGATPEFVAPAQPQREADKPAPAIAAAPAPAPEPLRAPEPAPVAKQQAQPQAEKAKQDAVKVEKAESEPERPKPVPAGAQRLVFHLEKEAWLEVRDGAGRLLVSSLNPAGTERAVQGRPPFEIVIGNASSVTLTQNGRPVDLKPHIKVEVARFTLK